MKKLSILLGSLILTAATYSAQLEVKAGLEPFREGKSNHADYSIGESIGMELLFNAENKPLDYGLGIEFKSKLDGDSTSNNELVDATAIPIYFTGKYGISKDLFYLVGRAGLVAYNDSSANDGFYGGIGLGKNFGPMTMETMYENMSVGNSSEQVSLVSLKMGFRIGENKRDIIAREAKELARLEYEKQQEEARLSKEAELEKQAALEAQALEEGRLAKEARLAILSKYENPQTIANYKSDKIEIDRLDKDILNNIKSDLKDESGTLQVKVYTDDTGSLEYNQKLSKERAEKLSVEIVNTIENENIEVTPLGLGEVEFLNENTTDNERYINRRAEINFIPQ